MTLVLAKMQQLVIDLGLAKLLVVQVLLLQPLLMVMQPLLMVMQPLLMMLLMA